ncbi:hypothetical protein GCK72_008292 [Caenorhabditis remanei]|uniref:Tyrosine-protein kinase n=1 Tax=Caenorhabditis remanei TaxID=31234 RepID=A0A6A5GZV3_CAERE|nr:hypothetical protein GCK72_008292 [Caenorhabditis remanei]KAF1760046.1 hypothetical protein GCK72_008292 [Caenorhabditis remanei]
MSLTISEGDDTIECVRHDPGDESIDGTNGGDGGCGDSEHGGQSTQLSEGGGNSSGSTNSVTSSGKENPEEEYIRNHLKHYTWYHGMMFGNIAASLLRYDNSYLVRRACTRDEKFLCISLRTGGKKAPKIYHYTLSWTTDDGWTCPKLFDKFPQIPRQRYEHIVEIINNWSHRFPNIVPIARRSMVVLHESINLERFLGRGAFGEVFKAKFTAAGATQPIEVAVKRTAGDAKRSAIQEFCHEASIQAVLQHENVVAFHGIASLEEPIMVVMELVTGGDLEKYLQKTPNVSKEQLIYFALNIACGMRHLARKNVIHRDLAARNCLITKDLKVKISDFGMSRRLSKGVPDFIEKKIKQAPIRWMAPESLLKGVFNEKTDVWSYGVVVAEMMTRCAHKPLYGFNKKEAQDHIKNNPFPHRVTAEKGDPKELAPIVDACCCQNIEERLDFQKVKQRVHAIYMQCLNPGTTITTTTTLPTMSPGPAPLEMKKSEDRQRNTTLGRKKSRDGRSKTRSSKRKFLSFRRRQKELQLPTGMTATTPGKPSPSPQESPAAAPTVLPTTTGSSALPTTTTTTTDIPMPPPETPPTPSVTVPSTQLQSPTSK